MWLENKDQSLSREKLWQYCKNIRADLATMMKIDEKGIDRSMIDHDYSLSLSLSFFLG